MFERGECLSKEGFIRLAQIYKNNLKIITFTGVKIVFIEESCFRGFEIESSDIKNGRAIPKKRRYTFDTFYNQIYFVYIGNSLIAKRKHYRTNLVIKKTLKGLDVSN